MIAILFIFVLFSIAMAIDIIYGEPPSIIHPVVIIGKSIAKLNNYYIKLKNKVLSGFLFLMTIIIINTVPVIIILYLLYHIENTVSIIIFSILYIYFLKSTFTVKAMKKHIKPVIEALNMDDIESARSSISKVVRRDTSSMDSEHIISAAIETIAEGFVDGYMTPLFFYAFGGIAAAIIAKVINTMDSNIAYKNMKYYEYGKATAIADSITNYIPSRLAIYIFAISAWILGYRHCRKIIINSTDSLNAGYSMGSMAIILDVRLEKPGEYIINPGGSAPVLEDIRKAIKIYYLSSLLFIIIFVLPVMAILFYLHLFSIF
ncbi:MAG: cobalamin biosynthesis protein [Ferroplasma sp.]